MQVDPIKPTLKAPGSMHLRLRYDGAVSNFAFKFNMCRYIEAGARAGLIAPDQVTFDYLKGRPMAPRGAAWDKAVAYWTSLASDADAKYDSEAGADTRPLFGFTKARVLWDRGAFRDR